MESLAKAGDFLYIYTMETRTITQVKIYFLAMNGVYDSAEGGSIAAVSTGRDKLIEYYRSQLLPDNERFRDTYGRYRSFKKGPLHDYNPLYTFDTKSDAFGHGLREEWIPEEDLYDVERRYHFVSE